MLVEAWRRGHSAEAHRLARRIAGARRGMGRRDFLAVKAGQPTKAEWATHLAKPGSEGGMAMTIFGPGAIREEHMTACAELPPLTEDAPAQAPARAR